VDFLLPDGRRRRGTRRRRSTSTHRRPRRFPRRRPGTSSCYRVEFKRCHICVLWSVSVVVCASRRVASRTPSSRTGPVAGRGRRAVTPPPPRRTPRRRGCTPQASAAPTKNAPAIRSAKSCPSSEIPSTTDQHDGRRRPSRFVETITSVKRGDRSRSIPTDRLRRRRTSVPEAGGRSVETPDAERRPVEAGATRSSRS